MENNKNNKIKFELTDKEWELFVNWASKKPPTNDPLGVQYSFIFTPTKIGQIVTIKCGKDELIVRS